MTRREPQSDRPAPSAPAAACPECSPLRDEFDRLRLTFDACLDGSSFGVAVADAAGRVAALNATLCELFELPREQHLGAPIEALFAAMAPRFADPEAFLERLRRLDAHDPELAPEPRDLIEVLGASLELGAEPGEAPRQLAVLATPITGAGRPAGRVYSFEDVSELRAEDDLLRKLGEASAGAFVITRVADGVILYANEELGRLLGVEVSSLIGSDAGRFYMEPEARAAFVEQLTRTGSVRDLELTLQHADGSPLCCVLSMNVANLYGEEVAIGSLFDISARKATEAALRHSQAMLATADKMASLGMLVAGIAHEINTPVGAVLSTQDTLTRAFERLKSLLGSLDPQTREQVAQLVQVIDDCNGVLSNGSQRVANIVRRLRRFARLDEAELQLASLEEGLDDTLALVQHELKQRIRVTRDYAGLPPVCCYAGRLNQVFLNLIVNALQAMEGPGGLTIRTFLRDGSVHVSFEDTGPGVAPEHLPRLFDPGFTTKGVGVGTGLGLAICYQIVQDHRGRIEVSSEPGKGARFEVTIPLDLGPPA
jgi:PAS domain S-box-containing protein